jgi:hypothetical protein
VIYKLLTKVIARHLKPILPFIISPEQSGYVEGRKILDNILLAHEVIHSLQTTGNPCMLLKLDLSKAFDKISWAYMKVVLLAFGFAQDWVNWILNLTSSAFFSILINGIPSRPLLTHSWNTTRGPSVPLPLHNHGRRPKPLHQSLHCRKISSGFTSSWHRPPISHSQFVDDTLMMGSPTVREAQRILNILNTFCAASGMDINRGKISALLF